MPRGIYDRSKMKDGAAPAAKAGAKPAQKRKGTRKIKAAAAELTGGAQVKSSGDAAYQLHSLQAYIGSLASISITLGTEAPVLLHGEIVASLERAREIRQEIFGRSPIERTTEEHLTKVSEKAEEGPATQSAPTQQLRPPPTPQQPFPPVSA